MKAATDRRTDPGQATIEFALILPIFVALLIAFIDVALIVRDQLLVDELARHSARLASTTSGVAQAESAIDALLQHAQRDDLTWSITTSPGIVEVRVSLEPRASMLLSTLQWIGSVERVNGRSVFPTEFEMVDH